MFKITISEIFCLPDSNIALSGIDNTIRGGGNTATQIAYTAHTAFTAYIAYTASNAYIHYLHSGINAYIYFFMVRALKYIGPNVMGFRNFMP